jgi:hypothetical protein
MTGIFLKSPSVSLLCRQASVLINKMNTPIQKSTSVYFKHSLKSKLFLCLITLKAFKAAYVNLQKKKVLTLHYSVAKQRD